VGKYWGGDLYTLENGEIGNDAWIGEGVTMMANVKIGNGVIIGACSFINKDIPPYAVAVGVPAKVIRYRFSDDKIKLMQTLQWWNWEPDKILHEYKRLQDFDFTLLG